MDFAEATLVEVLIALGLSPPPKLAKESLPAIWSWAIENWEIENLCGRAAIVKTS